MKFTGHSLKLLRQGVLYALDETQNQIATCPDVNLYGEEIKQLEADAKQLNNLLERINKAIAKEGSK